MPGDDKEGFDLTLGDTPEEESPEEAAGDVIEDKEEESSRRTRMLNAAAAAIRAKKQHEALKTDREKAEEEKRLSLLVRIQRMDVGDKQKLARAGDKECRTILIKDANKQVAMAALLNPKMTIQEIEVIAASRNVDDDILRMIAESKDWCKSYAVVLGLTNNPKTPLIAAMRFLPKLLTRDIRMIARSKNVAEPLRVAARKLVDKRLN